LPAVKRRVRRRSNNNEQSGGLPHSDIHGSKPIPGSPWLNAGYHVLHRLLLPRHPPNALIALDPTRKEQGRTPFVKCSHPSGRKSSSHGGTTPCRVYHRSVVLDLEQFRACRCVLRRPADTPLTRGHQHETDVFLSQRCQTRRPKAPHVPPDDPNRIMRPG